MRKLWVLIAFGFSWHIYIKKTFRESERCDAEFQTDSYFIKNKKTFLQEGHFPHSLVQSLNVIGEGRAG